MLQGGVLQGICIRYSTVASSILNPHYISGDFAVLLKTGMGIKEALFFNVVSSILCLIGMLVGIGVGNVEAASSWIFAFTAGTFVYIALVDMVGLFPCQ